MKLFPCQRLGGRLFVKVSTHHVFMILAIKRITE
jgi:hypothetical protein